MMIQRKKYDLLFGLSYNLLTDGLNASSMMFSITGQIDCK